MYGLYFAYMQICYFLYKNKKHQPNEKVHKKHVNEEIDDYLSVVDF